MSSQTTTRPSPRPVVAILVAVLVLAGVLIGVFTGSAQDSSSAPDGHPAPDVSFRLFDGSQATLADYRGKPVVLNFWASWCPACVAEMPSFQQVHEEIGGEVLFLGLGVQDTRDAAEAFVAQSGVTYLLGEDPDGSILGSFDGIAMPTTVFIDETGSVVGRHSGAIFEDDLRELIGDLFGV